MFQSMLTSRLISADVCGTVMDSLSLQMAQVLPCALARTPRLALSWQRSNCLGVAFLVKLPIRGGSRCAPSCSRNSLLPNGGLSCIHYKPAAGSRLPVISLSAAATASPSSLASRSITALLQLCEQASWGDVLCHPSRCPAGHRRPWRTPARPCR